MATTLTATAYDPTFGACTVTKVTARPFTYAVIRVSDDGTVSASFHLTRDNADRAAGRPARGVTRHVVQTSVKRPRPTLAPTITEVAAGSDITDMIRDNLNRGLMVHWINRDLINRADCDVRKSIVFYDADRMFVMALGTSVTPALFRERLDTLPNAIAAAYRMGVRYWSVGIA